MFISAHIEFKLLQKIVEDYSQLAFMRGLRRQCHGPGHMMLEIGAFLNSRIELFHYEKDDDGHSYMNPTSIC